MHTQTTDFEALAVPIMQQWVAARGETESGAYSYYRVRLGRNRLLVPYELAVYDYIKSRADKRPLVIEVGAGWGQLPALLAAESIDAISVDMDRRRHAGAEHLKNELAKHLPTVGRHLSLVHGFFPTDLDPRVMGGDRYKILVLTNVVNTKTNELLGEIMSTFRLFDEVLVDLGHLGQQRETAEHQQLVAQLEAAGCVLGELLYRSGSSALYRATSRPT